MPKMKTKRALKKRVRKNAEGKLKRGYAFRSHLALDKTTKQKRHFRKRPFMHPSDEKRLKSLLQD